MAPLPHDIVLLIAEHIESSELRSLALCHRYFLYKYLKQRYLRPVVVADSLQDEKCRRLLESNIVRISGPLVRDLVHRLELRFDDAQQPKKKPKLSSFLDAKRLSITGNATPGTMDSMLLHTLCSFTHLRALHIIQLQTPYDNTSPSPSYETKSAWMRLLPHAWPTIAPRLEELHAVGPTRLLENVFSLKPHLCKALSTLRIEVSPENAYDSRPVSKSMGKFVMALSAQLVSFALLLGDDSSSGPRILVGDRDSGAAHVETDFPRLRALRIDLASELSSSWTSYLLSTCLIRHHSLIQSLSIRYHAVWRRGNSDFRAQPLIDLLLQDVSEMNSVWKLDLDVDPLLKDNYGAWPTHGLEDQKQILDAIGLIEGLEELRFRPTVTWEPNPRTTTGVASMLSPASTFSGHSRIFRSLKNLYINLLYLRAQIFEDMAEGAPQLESIHLVFQEFWLPKLSFEKKWQNGQYTAPITCVSYFSSEYQPHLAVLLFSTEVKSLRHLRDMRLRNLRLSWTSASRWSNHRSLKEDMMVALKQVIPSLGSPVTGSVKFVDPLEDWEQNLWWVDSGRIN